MLEGGLSQNAVSRRVLDRLPTHIAEGLTVEQRIAIAEAARENTFARPPVNIRISARLPFRRYFLTILAGPERRNAERVREERRQHPRQTKRNFLFVVLAALAFYASAVLALRFLTTAIGA